MLKNHENCGPCRKNFVRGRIVDSLIETIKNILYKILFISRCNSSSLIGTILIYIYFLIIITSI